MFLTNKNKISLLASFFFYILYSGKHHLHLFWAYKVNYSYDSMGIPKEVYNCSHNLCPFSADEILDAFLKAGRSPTFLMVLHSCYIGIELYSVLTPCLNGDGLSCQCVSADTLINTVVLNKWCGSIKAVQGRHHRPLSPDAVRWVKGRVARSLIGQSAR